jgi:tetratricopeptide (TPR) repeat protein
LKKARSKKKTVRSTPQKEFFLQKYISRKEFAALLIIMMGGFLLRLFYVIEISESFFIQSPVSDSLIYLEWAREIAAGSWFADRVFYMSPVYSYFLAVIHTIFSDTVFAAQVIQVFLNTINILLIYIAAKRIFSQQEAFISAVIAAVYSLFIFYTGLILIEVLHTFILSAFLIYLIRMKDEINKGEFLIAGLLFGLLILFRGNIILFLPVLLAWLYFRYERDLKKLLKPSGLFLLGVFLPLSFITLNNYLAEGDVVILTSNGGINFYLGNNPSATGIYMNPGEFRLETDLTGGLYAERVMGRELTPGEVSDFWFAKGFEYVRENPLDAARLFFIKLLLFFDDSENSQSASMDIGYFSENYSDILKIPLPGFYLIMLLAAAGIILSWEKRKKFDILLLFIIVYAAATALFFVTGRFRVPAAPMFILFSGAGIYRIYIILKGKEFRKLMRPAAAVIILIAMNITLTPSFTFSNYDALIHMGRAHYDNKEYDKAIEYYTQSLREQDDYATYVLLGNALAARGDLNNAMGAFLIAVERNPDYELGWFNLGALNIQLRNTDEALKNFKKVIEINPTFEDAYKNIGIIYYIQGDNELALEYFEKYLVYAKDEHTRYTVSRDIEELRKEMREN